MKPASPMDRAFLTDDPDAGHLLLVRHGQQEFPDPETATVADWVDPPLSALGQQQATAVGKYLADHPVSTVYSSHLSRAHNTGLAVAGAHGLDVSVVPGLAEIELFSQLDDDARPVDVLGEQAIQGVRERFVQARTWDVYPYSESSLEFRRRVGYSIEGIMAHHPGETVVVACHSGVINLITAMVLGLETDFVFRAAHASVSWLRFGNEKRVIESLNDHSFLRPVELLSY